MGERRTESTSTSTANRVRINLWIDKDQKRRLDVIQENIGISVSEQIRRAIALWLEKCKGW